MLAARCNSASCVTMLLHHGANPHVQNKFGDTALSIACCRKWSLKIVETLIESGADIHTNNLDRQSPLLIAVKHGHIKIVKLLVRCGARKNDIDIYGKCVDDYVNDKLDQDIQKQLRDVLM